MCALHKTLGHLSSWFYEVYDHKIDSWCVPIHCFDQLQIFFCLVRQNTTTFWAEQHRCTDSFCFARGTSTVVYIIARFGVEARQTTTRYLPGQDTAIELSRTKTCTHSTNGLGKGFSSCRLTHQGLLPLAFHTLGSMVLWADDPPQDWLCCGGAAARYKASAPNDNDRGSRRLAILPRGTMWSRRWLACIRWCTKLP